METEILETKTKKQQQQTPKPEMLKIEVDKSAQRHSKKQH